VADSKNKGPRPYIEKEYSDAAADPVIRYMTKEQLEKAIIKTKRSMESAVKELDFIQAAKFRDELFALEKTLSDLKSN
jgi:excinuclease ABC subunit B